MFTKGPREEVITINYSPDRGMTSKQTTKFDDVMETIKESVRVCDTKEDDTEYASCVANSVIDDISRITDSKELLKTSRNNMAGRLRNYTCSDPTMKTSTPISTYPYSDQQGKKFRVDTLFDTSHAKIWKVDNFITQEECNVLIDYGRPRLQRATVAAEDGSSVVSENRKAQQASYDLRKNSASDPLW